MGVRLSTFIEGHKAEAVLAPLFKLLEAVFELLVPLLMADLVDVGVANGDRAYIYAKGMQMVPGKQKRYRVFWDLPFPHQEESLQRLVR